MSASNPSAQASGTPGGMEDTKETRSSEHSREDIPINSEKLWLYEQGVLESQPNMVPEVQKEVDTCPHS